MSDKVAPKLTPQKTIYVYTPDEITSLIAHNLGLNVNRVSVRYVVEQVGGDTWGRSETHKMTRVEVEVYT